MKFASGLLAAGLRKQAHPPAPQVSTIFIVPFGQFGWTAVSKPNNPWDCWFGPAVK
jgi:hypothetical protein